MPNNIIYEFSNRLKNYIDKCEEIDRSNIKLRSSAPPESNKNDNLLNKNIKLNKSDNDEEEEEEEKEKDGDKQNEEKEEELLKAKRLRADSTPALNNDIENLATIKSISFINENLSRKRKTPQTDFSIKTEPNEIKDNDVIGDQITALMMAAASGNLPFLAAAINQNIKSNTSTPINPTAPSSTSSISSTTNNTNLILNDNSYILCDSGGASPQKRARTRITDEQLKILRQYFDINNSPSEEQIKEMSIKSQLPEKVIKHWFRNTLFKVFFLIILF